MQSLATLHELMQHLPQVTEPPQPPAGGGGGDDIWSFVTNMSTKTKSTAIVVTAAVATIFFVYQAAKKHFTIPAIVGAIASCALGIWGVSNVASSTTQDRIQNTFNNGAPAPMVQQGHGHHTPPGLTFDGRQDV